MEQSCIVWHPNLTQKITDYLEICHITFAKLALHEKYKHYEQSLFTLNLTSLIERRSLLSERFAENGIKHKTSDDLFPLNLKNHKMEAKTSNKYLTKRTKLERAKRSSNFFIPSQLHEKYHEERKQ